MKFPSTVITSIIITLFFGTVQGAIIPKGISSLLTNSKVPTEDDVFTSDKKETVSKVVSKGGTVPSSILSSNQATDTKMSESIFNIQNFNIGSLFQNNHENYNREKINYKENIDSTKMKITSLEDFADTFKDFSNDYDNDKTTAILLSSNIINGNSLKKLGIKGISFKLPVINNKLTKSVHEPSFLPFHTKPLFLFNLKEPINFSPYTLSGSIPLQINGNFQINDYNILVPISYMQKLKLSSVFMEQFLIENKDKLLFYNNELSFETPILITMIDQQQISVPKTSSCKLSSLIFDLLSKNWLQSSANSIDLTQLTVCMLNNNDNENKDNKSICLRINDNGNSIDVAPSFDTKNKFNFNGIFNTQPQNSRSLEKRNLLFQFPQSSFYSNNTSLEKEMNQSNFSLDNDKDKDDDNYFVKSEEYSPDFGSRLSFKIQDGGNELTPNEISFKNLTKCNEEEDYLIPEKPLVGSIFGNKEKSKIGMSSIHEVSPVLKSRPRPVEYQQIIQPEISFTF